MIYRYLVLFFSLCIPLLLGAQIKGYVKDSQGHPLPGAHIRWAGAKSGIATDNDGHFHLHDIKTNKHLVASYVGFKNDSIFIDGKQTEVTFFLEEDATLSEATVLQTRTGTYKSFNSVENVDLITSSELCRAACCNLGESFVTNPSVDVSYSDAATGAKQIRLLGLSGTYVQMLTEGIPNFRGIASPYGLGYVPGPWMQSIQVSKGAASVKNGYEAMTGQINVEYHKPQKADADWLSINLFGDIDGRLEGNADATFKLGEKWSTTILGHYEKALTMHDSNDDGFADIPQVEQYNFMNRWAYMGDKYVFQAGAKVIGEDRKSGQVHHNSSTGMPRYAIDITTHRYEGFAKQAYIFNHEHNTNLALVLSGSLHQQEGLYGNRRYNVDQSEAYASLMFETEFNKQHSLSTGLSFNHDHLSRNYREARLPNGLWTESANTENVSGAYAQYTFAPNDKFLVMAGIRGDYSNLYDAFVTPRLHLKYTPNMFVNLRASVGKGYRTAFVRDENSYLFSGSREIISNSDYEREEAWNYGASGSFKIPAGDEKLITLNLEYYYTDFQKQLVADMDSDPHAIRFHALNGRSYSQVFQIEATYPAFAGFTATAAYRYTDAKCTYGGRLREKPLTNKFKALLTLSYKTPLELWQFDATLQWNGGGRMPDPYTQADGTLSWNRRFNSYPMLSAQITRYFRNCSIYIGGENLTGFRQKNAIIDADNPWGNNFDPTMVWGPVHGVKAYIGVRYNIPRN